MPTIDFSKVEDAQDFSPIPDGEYLCRVHEVEKAVTQNGDEMFKLRFAVIEGEHIGRIIFDNMVFSKAALKRAKFICSNLGIDVLGKTEITPELLKDRRCYVSVITEEYEDDAGNTKKHSRVPFAGYKKA
jgi:hypothetical protein